MHRWLLSYSDKYQNIIWYNCGTVVDVHYITSFLVQDLHTWCNMSFWDLLVWFYYSKIQKWQKKDKKTSKKIKIEISIKSFVINS